MTTCCTGTAHKGTPKGRVETLHTFSTYIADPPNSEPKGIITIVPDAFGWNFINNRLLADVYAERIGARVLLPDFMDGACASFSMHPPASTVKTLAMDWVKLSAKSSLVNGRKQCRSFIDGPSRENDGQQCFLCKPNVRQIPLCDRWCIGIAFVDVPLRE